MLPLWEPGGTQLAYTTRISGGTSDITSRSIMGTSNDDVLLVRSPEMKIGGNWTADRRYLVYTGSDPDSRLDLWLLQAGGGAKPVPFLRTPFNEMHGQLSPDGRWIAYVSDESGRWEVYVQTFPEPGAKRVISAGGGAEPQWRRDGRELYYLAPDGTLMAVPIATGGALDAGLAKPLFRAPITADIITYRNHYAVTADGQRFLVDSADEREPINVVVNWQRLIGKSW